MLNCNKVNILLRKKVNGKCSNRKVSKYTTKPYVEIHSLAAEVFIKSGKIILRPSAIKVTLSKFEIFLKRDDSS